MLRDRDAWEYRIELFDARLFGLHGEILGGGRTPDVYPVTELDALGADGWELVAAEFREVEHRPRWVCVLKRRRE